MTKIGEPVWQCCNRHFEKWSQGHAESSAQGVTVMQRTLPTLNRAHHTITAVNVELSSSNQSLLQAFASILTLQRHIDQARASGRSENSPVNCNLSPNQTPTRWIYSTLSIPDLYRLYDNMSCRNIRTPSPQ